MSWLAMAALGLFATLIQVSLPASWLPLDLPLLVCIFAGLRRGSGHGLAAAAAAGLALDLLVSPQPGLRTAALVLAGGAADTLGRRANLEQPRLRVLAAGGLSLAHDIALVWMAARLGLNQGGWRHVGFYYLLPRLALHCVLAIPFFYLFGRVLKAGVFRRPQEGEVAVIRKLPR